VELVTLKLNGETHPAPDSQLANFFGGGISSPGSDTAEETETPPDPSSSSSGTGSSSGQTNSSISGAPQSGSFNISGN